MKFSGVDQARDILLKFHAQQISCNFTICHFIMNFRSLSEQESKGRVERGCLPDLKSKN